MAKVGSAVCRHAAAPLGNKMGVVLIKWVQPKKFYTRFMCISHITPQFWNSWIHPCTQSIYKITSITLYPPVRSRVSLGSSIQQKNLYMYIHELWTYLFIPVFSLELSLIACSIHLFHTHSCSTVQYNVYIHITRNRSSPSLAHTHTQRRSSYKNLIGCAPSIS